MVDQTEKSIFGEEYVETIKLTQDHDHRISEFLLDEANIILTEIRSSIKSKRLIDFSKEDRLAIIKEIRRVGKLLINTQDYIIHELEDHVIFQDSSVNLSSSMGN